MLQLLLINIMLAFAPSEKSNLAQDCSKFKTGAYRLLDDDGSPSQYIIKRDGSLQVETDEATGKFSNYEVVWTSDCAYFLKYAGGTFETHPEVQKKLLFVEILKTEKDKYKYVCWLEGFEDQKMYGWLQKI